MNKNEENEAFRNYCKFSTKIYERFISTLKDDVQLPLSFRIIQNMLEKYDDWHTIIAAITALRKKEWEFTDDVEKIVPMIPTIINLMKNQNAIIRFAADFWICDF